MMHINDNFKKLEKRLSRFLEMSAVNEPVPEELKKSIQSLQWGVNLVNDYAQYQIAASECLRAGSLEGISKEERRARLVESQKYSEKAFLTAAENVYMRFLAISQYQCAAGMLVLVDNNYDSVVVSSGGHMPKEVATEMIDKIKQQDDKVLSDFKDLL